jgi:transposase
MAARTGAAHVVTTRCKYKDTVYETHLLRRSYRVGNQVKNETLGNLSHLPAHVIDLIRRSLKGERFLPASEAFEITHSRAHGHVQAITQAMQRLGFASLIASKASPQRDRVMAMVAARILSPNTKLATTRWWHTTTLAETFNVSDADEDDLYAAMDWLLARQSTIEKKLVKRHHNAGERVLYDLSSSYFEGSTCPLAKRGYSRDHRRDKLQVNYGLLTNALGCPMAISAFAGNTADSLTFLPAVEQLCHQYGVERLVMIGDRGMISNKAIAQMRSTDGVDWITALKGTSIRALIHQTHLQLDLFDERNLLAFRSPDYPGERLVACRNLELARLRAHKREELLCATERHLDKIRDQVQCGKLQGEDKIGVKVGRVVNQYKVAKHFHLDISGSAFSFTRDAQRIATEAALDGLYVIRTSLPKKQMDSAECVRSYKSLAQVERAFRSIKGMDLKVRPIHHRLEGRVRAHLLLCMLAYYVEWHLREAWRELLFADTDQAAKASRDPVAPAKRSASALQKVSSHTLPDGTPAHSFATLIAALSMIVRNTCLATQPGEEATPFDITTTANEKQRRAFELLKNIKV